MAALFRHAAPASRSIIAISIDNPNPAIAIVDIGPIAYSIRTLGSAPALHRPGFRVNDHAGERAHRPWTGRALRKLVPLFGERRFDCIRNTRLDGQVSWLMVCGNGEAGKLRVDQRGASIAC